MSTKRIRDETQRGGRTVVGRVASYRCEHGHAWLCWWAAT